MSYSGVPEELDQVRKIPLRIVYRTLIIDRVSCYCHPVLPEGSSQAKSHVEVNLHLPNITIQSSHGLDNKGKGQGTKYASILF